MSGMLIITVFFIVLTTVLCQPTTIVYEYGPTGATDCNGVPAISYEITSQCYPGWKQGDYFSAYCYTNDSNVSYLQCKTNCDYTNCIDTTYQMDKCYPAISVGPRGVGGPYQLRCSDVHVYNTSGKVMTYKAAEVTTTNTCSPHYLTMSYYQTECVDSESFYCNATGVVYRRWSFTTCLGFPIIDTFIPYNTCYTTSSKAFLITDCNQYRDAPPLTPLPPPVNIGSSSFGYTGLFQYLVVLQMIYAIWL